MPSIDARLAATVLSEARPLHSPDAVRAALQRVAGEINSALADADPVLLCAMIGGLAFAGQLLPLLCFPHQLDYLHVTRYRGATAGGELQWRARPTTPLADRTVLILDDIFDEGATLAAMLDYCRGAGTRHVFSAVLVDKRHARKVPDIRPDFIGLTVDDHYVFGCGMDYRGYLRHTAGIYAVS